MTLTGPFNLKTTRELLASLGHSPKKWLGQNFLVDGNIVRKSLELAEIRACDVVVEVGPGLGTLTTTLLQAGTRVFAVERDATLAAHLWERVSPIFPETFDLKEADAMDFPLAAFSEKMPAGTPFKIVANLPYAISTPWMDAVLESGNLPETLVLMLQKEAADRFTATVGTKNFGALSIFLDAAYERAPGHKVPASCFFPPPKVDSYLLHLRRRERPFVFGKTARRLIRGIFIYRRKQLSSAVKKAIEDISSNTSQNDGSENARPNSDAQKNSLVEKITAWLEMLPQFGVSSSSRPECVPAAAWRKLAEILG